MAQPNADTAKSSSQIITSSIINIMSTKVLSKRQLYSTLGNHKQQICSETACLDCSISTAINDQQVLTWWINFICFTAVHTGDCCIHLRVFRTLHGTPPHAKKEKDNEINIKKKRQDYAFWRQFYEQPSTILGCPGPSCKQQSQQQSLLLMQVIPVAMLVWSTGQTDWWHNAVQH